MRHVRFAGPAELHAGAAEAIARRAVQAIEARGRFAIALSGGKTPIPVYEQLGADAVIDWQNTHVFWSDERCVPPEDDSSNFGSAKRVLLDRVNIPGSNIHRIPGEQSPVDAAQAYEKTLRELIPDGRLDLILLGMGADGHTASLFPGHPALQERERWILPVHVRAEPPWRVTMTLPLINNARHVLMLSVGQEKEQTRKRIAAGEDLPAGRVRPSAGEFAWYTSSGP